MTDDFKALASQLRDLQDASKAQIAGVMARAEEAGLDPAGLRRFVSWKRKNEEKRAQQEAIDQQCRYLAGERDTPAQLPIGCELAQALNLYRRDFTVRQVAEELRISTGKAGKLRQLSRMFVVHVHATVDKPTHDPATGEITETAAGDRPREESPATDGPGSSLSSGARQVPTGQPGNTGGINEQAHLNQSAGIKTSNNSIDESPAGGEKPVTPAGGHHAKRRLTVEPEVARVAPPALGAVGAKPRVASDNDWPEMPAGLRRVRP